MKTVLKRILLCLKIAKIQKSDNNIRVVLVFSIIPLHDNPKKYCRFKFYNIRHRKNKSSLILNEDFGEIEEFRNHSIS